MWGKQVLSGIHGHDGCLRFLVHWKVACVCKSEIDLSKICHPPTERCKWWFHMGFRLKATISHVFSEWWIIVALPQTKACFFWPFQVSNLGVSKNRGGPPKWMVKIMENPMKLDDLGGKPSYFRKHPNRDVYSPRSQVPRFQIRLLEKIGGCSGTVQISYTTVPWRFRGMDISCGPAMLHPPWWDLISK